MILRLNRQEFEYDTYSLIKAFYPDGKLKCVPWEEPFGEADCDARFTLCFTEDAAFFHVKIHDRVLEDSCTLVIGEDKAGTKIRFEKMIYHMLACETGRELPWGILTGVRPTKIVMGMLEAGVKNSEIATCLKDKYLVSDEKVTLSIATANQERALLADFDFEKGYSLYVGIPFCPSICLYCSFGSHPMKQWGHLVDDYLKALCKELDYIAKRMKGHHLDTVYMGGGTPTTLEPYQMRRLLSYIADRFALAGIREFTVEAGRPDTITQEKLKVLKDFPVNRISINPQTMNQATLNVIGRKHTVEEIIEKYHLARSVGFDNINMDLIIGLPGEGAAEVNHTLEEIKKLDPDSLTIHSLALKRAARLNLFQDVYREISFENSSEIMNLTENCAMDLGMRPYYMYRQKNMAGNFENVGYAKEKKAGLYNILIMEEKQTIIAAGSGATTKLVLDGGQRIERVENVKDLKNYIERIDEMIERKRTGIHF